MIRSVEGDWDRRPPKGSLGLLAGLDGVHLPGEALELPVRGERRRSPVDADDVHRLLILSTVVLLARGLLGVAAVVVVAPPGRALSIAAAPSTTPVAASATALAAPAATARAMGAIAGNMPGLAAAEASVAAAPLPGLLGLPGLPLFGRKELHLAAVLQIMPGGVVDRAPRTAGVVGLGLLRLRLRGEDPLLVTLRGLLLAGATLPRQPRRRGPIGLPRHARTCQPAGTAQRWTE